MNNLRLLTGSLLMTLCAGGMCAAQPVAKVYTLEEIFESAETGSAGLRPLFTAEEEARREISVARTQFLPDLDASLSLSYIGDGFTTKRNFTDYQRAPIPHFGSGIGLKVTQPIYTGGALTSSLQLAQMKATASVHATDLYRDNLRFKLTELYLDAYKYVNLRTVVQYNLVSARKVLEDMNARYEQGTVLRNDITRYELLVADLELELLRIDNTIDILNHNLVVTAGLPEGTVVKPDTTILARSLKRADASEWLGVADRNAPTLKLARSGVDISRKAEELVKADLRPKIGIQAGWTIDGPILVEVPPINRNLSYWYVGVNVSYNFSSLYKSNKALARSKSATRRTMEQLEAAEEEIGMTVRTDYIRYLEAYEELKSRNIAVDLAKRNYENTYTRYSSDMALITDMLDAANARLAAEQQLVDARINIIYTYYKLLFSTGTI